MKEEKKYFIGVDFAIKPKWWQRLIVWLGLRKRWDYSCMVFWRKEKDGTMTIVDKHYF